MWELQREVKEQWLMVWAGEFVFFYPEMLFILFIYPRKECNDKKMHDMSEAKSSTL